VSRQAEQLREEARFKALRLIDANPRITQRELADNLGISLGATHYMLRALAERGLVKLGRFSASEDKRGYAYALTPKGLSEKAAITVRFLARKRAEYDLLKAEIEQLSAELAPEDGEHHGQRRNRRVM
jgi:EPS-associated MarR family transcriptional regulator